MRPGVAVTYHNMSIPPNEAMLEEDASVSDVSDNELPQILPQQVAERLPEACHPHQDKQTPLNSEPINRPSTKLAAKLHESDVEMANLAKNATSTSKKVSGQWFLNYNRLKLHREGESKTFDYSLRDWAHNQKAQFRFYHSKDPKERKKCKLSEEQITLLRQIGFEWGPKGAVIKKLFKKQKADPRLVPPFPYPNFNQIQVNPQVFPFQLPLPLPPRLKPDIEKGQVKTDLVDIDGVNIPFGNAFSKPTKNSSNTFLAPSRTHPNSHQYHNPFMNKAFQGVLNIDPQIWIKPNVFPSRKISKKGLNTNYEITVKHENEGEKSAYASSMDAALKTKRPKTDTNRQTKTKPSAALFPIPRHTVSARMSPKSFESPSIDDDQVKQHKKEFGGKTHNSLQKRKQMLRPNGQRKSCRKTRLHQAETVIKKNEMNNEIGCMNFRKECEIIWKNTLDDIISFAKSRDLKSLEDLFLDEFWEPNSSIYRLRNWLMQQRKQYLKYKEGKPNCLTKEMVFNLEKAGITWKSCKDNELLQCPLRGNMNLTPSGIEIEFDNINPKQVEEITNVKDKNGFNHNKIDIKERLVMPTKAQDSLKNCSDTQDMSCIKMTPDQVQIPKSKNTTSKLAKSLKDNDFPMFLTKSLFVPKSQTIEETQMLDGLSTSQADVISSLIHTQELLQQMFESKTADT